MTPVPEGALIRFGDIAFNETHGSTFVILKHTVGENWAAIALGGEVWSHTEPTLATIWLGSPAVRWRLYRG